MKAVILAAGRGERLMPLTEDKPKPLVEAKGKPIIEHVLDALPSTVSEAIIVIGYKGQMIKDHLGLKYKKVKLTYVEQEEQKGTYDALTCAKEKLEGEEHFLVLNSDEILDPVDVAYLSRRKNAVLTATYRIVVPYGVIDKNGIREKPTFSLMVVTGAYTLTPEIFELPEPHEVLAVNAGMLKLVPITASSFDTLTTPKDYERLS